MKLYTKKIEVKRIKDSGYHLFINCKVNGENCKMIIDTGASNTIFDKNADIFRNTNMQNQTIECHSLNAEESKIFVGLINELKIGLFTIKLEKMPFISLDYINNIYEKHKIKKIIGIIGSDFLFKYNAIIDFQEKKIILKK